MTTLDPERQRQARQYARLSHRLWLAGTLLGGAYAAAWLVLGWGVSLRDYLLRASPVFGNPLLLVLTFAIVFGGLFLIVELPVSYYSGFLAPHQFGQSTQNLRAWIVDQLKGLLIGAPIGIFMLELLYLALRAAGGSWWLWAAGGLVVFNVLLSNLAPVLILPLFNRYVPLGEEHRDLAERLQRLAAAAHARVRGVYTFDMSRRTKSANAALTGIGSTRRVILGDTLIDEFSADEIEAVLAHELGHHVHRDLSLYIAFGAFSTVVGLYLASVAMTWANARFGFTTVSDIASLPALALVLGAYGLVTMPLENALSRWRERLADEYALDATGKNAAFASAFVRLANQNLGEVDPEPWVVWMFHSHPPLGKRIAAAENWRRAGG
jgi:Zn-dependent protease with chaperone function